MLVWLVMPRRISPVTSIFLDAARFLLALSVAVGHFSQPMFQTGWPEITDLAVAAVGGFFLLSGFTIRMLTPAEERFQPKAYFVERLSRLWSVMLPAVAVTVVFDAISRRADPSLYAQHWAVNGTQPVLRIAVNLLFLNELWGRDLKLFSNSLFWSLGYEAGFYLLYGLWRSREGRARYLLAALGCLFLGPNIVFMLSIWLLGVLLHDGLMKLDVGARQTKGLFALAGGVLGAGTIAMGVLQGKTAFAAAAEVTGHCAFAAFAPLDHALFPLTGLHVGPARIDGRLLAGAVACAMLLGPGLLVAQAIDPIVTIPRALVRSLRKMGDFTFPLYLMHFPTFVLLRSIGVYDLASPIQKVVTFVGVCGVIFWLTRYGNSFKLTLRRALTFSVSRASSRFAPGEEQLQAEHD